MVTTMTTMMTWVIGTEEGRVGISEQNPRHPGGMAWVVGGEPPRMVYRTPAVMDRLNKGLLKEALPPTEENDGEGFPTDPSGEERAAIDRAAAMDALKLRWQVTNLDCSEAIDRAAAMDALKQINGVGEATAGKLVAGGYTSVQEVASVYPDDLRAIGLSAGVAARVVSAARRRIDGEE